MPLSIDRTRYLCTSKPGDWSNVLNTSLGFLRDSWSEQTGGKHTTKWIGIPQVLEVCISLVLTPSLGSKRICNLIKCARMVAVSLELHALKYPEPKYHNRLHFCDALTGICVLLLIEKERTSALDEYWVALLLLVVVSHDYMHPGGQNSKAMEIEIQTLNELKNIWSVHPIDTRSQEYVTYIIQKSDPRYVRDNHKLVATTPFAWSVFWATVLLNEADILASCTTKYGAHLGEQLLCEWQLNRVRGTLLRGAKEIRRNFLKSAMFSSPASQILQIHIDISVQLQVSKSSHNF